MTKLTHEDQSTLLELLSSMGSAGRAEGENESRFSRTYHPVQEHLRAFDPEVVLVVGPRGAGKTELFRAGIEFGLLPAIEKYLPQLRLPPVERTELIKAYPIGSEFPDDRGIKQFAANVKKGGGNFIDVWFAYLVRILRDRINNTVNLNPLLNPPGADISGVMESFNKSGQAPVIALDELDKRLETEDKYLFVGYDELDTLGHGHWETINEAVKGLVGFWSSYSRRWRRIRAKIFLRTDLYNRAGVAAGADFAKLSANRAEIAWSDANLYAMLLKRIMNSSDELFDYCKSKVKYTSDDRLGKIPTIARMSDAVALVELMVQKYMGANARKGLTYRWLLDHIRDGRGHAMPRALVRLIEKASEEQKTSGRFHSSPHLIEPRSLRRALDFISEEHVTQSLDEWPWLEGLKDRLRNNREVPWERKKVERLLADKLEESWSTSDVLPPTDNPRDLVDYLIEIGIFRERSNGRVDVTDLFLAGLGLKRKGGVRRE